MITLFPDEKIITNSNANKVVLTTHRICYEYKEWGRSYNQSIMLEHITSCENYNTRKNWLLVLSILSGLISIYVLSEDNSDMFSFFFIIAIIALVLFWITRKNSIIIGSPSTKMILNVTGMKRENILSFINTIEQTKHKRQLTLNKKD